MIVIFVLFAEPINLFWREYLSWTLFSEVCQNRKKRDSFLSVIFVALVLLTNFNVVRAQEETTSFRNVKQHYVTFLEHPNPISSTS
jgi:hypothetical protein